ncbi:hypothetical protein J4Q44_G00163240 [Coregonus suidteri]|uniref:Uncharacterized protein n=1 Tax=Coregonus suidteri TaxID=861788 RepID=A0AAN8LIN6_9TELE
MSPSGLIWSSVRQQDNVSIGPAPFLAPLLAPHLTARPQRTTWPGLTVCDHNRITLLHNLRAFFLVIHRMSQDAIAHSSMSPQKSQQQQQWKEEGVTGSLTLYEELTLLRGWLTATWHRDCLSVTGSLL